LFASLKYLVRCISGACAGLMGWNTKLSLAQTLLGDLFIGFFGLIAVLSYFIPIKAGCTKISAFFIALSTILACLVAVVLLSCFVDFVRCLWMLMKK